MNQLPHASGGHPERCARLASTRAGTLLGEWTFLFPIEVIENARNASAVVISRIKRRGL